MKSRNQREGQYLGFRPWALGENKKRKHWRMGSVLHAQGHRAYRLKAVLCHHAQIND